MPLTRVPLNSDFFLAILDKIGIIKNNATVWSSKLREKGG
jgi:hypothetical protein